MKIAIVGLALRFPGDIDSEEAFWDVLKNARDMVGEVSSERWGTDVYSHPRRSEPGRSISFSAGLLSRIDEFDAAFFGISPREAKQLDPQQRLLLEMTWEAMENGGQVPAKLAGSDCAVYIGISGIDYGLRSIDDLSAVNAYTMTGNTLSIAANRISYVFDLHGPSMAVDTACSSSMIALHQACQSLRNGESSMAIAGGINLLLHPYPFVGFTKASMLSADGRCKTFDASGDGYVRAEGGAILFLKPYDQAVADGDPIHAVILGTGVNTDGHKSGITIPSASAQAELMQNVCRQAGVKPDDLAYVEAHGTGTAVGDPIETAAIGEAIGKRRASGKPLYVGSVKSNLGHLEPASGMAGLVKTVLCLKQRALPASLHLKTPNPHIDFEGLRLKPVTELTPLPANGSPLRMGINSFGFGGANAHVLLEEAPSPAPVAGKDEATVPPLFLSARDPKALQALAARYAERIAEAGPGEYYDIAHTAAFRRQRLEHQMVAFGASSRDIEHNLSNFAADGHATGTVADSLLSENAKLAFVYSGNGAQWAGMGRQLMEESALFRATIEEIDALLVPMAGFSLLEEFASEPIDSRLHLTEVAQPALFAIQVGVTRLLREQGLDADAALGHSVGEIAAAWAAGALSLEQAVKVIYERSAAQALTKGSGRMAAVGMSPEKMQETLAMLGLTGIVEIAGINSPSSITLSGSLADLEKIQAALEPGGTFFRLLDLDYAFHSRQMESIRERVLTDLADLKPVSGKGRFVSTVTGETLDGAKLDADYWWHNIRQPVQFAKAVAGLIEDGYEVFLEIGPHAILQHYIGESLKAAKSRGKAVPILKRNHESLARVLEAGYRVHMLGCPLDTAKLFPHEGKYTPLPNYPWQRERHWYSSTSEAYGLINRERVHPLLGYRLKNGEAIWENQLDPHTVPYLRDHVVGGAIVLPAAAYAELALAASVQHFGSATHEIEDLEIRIPILLDEEHARSVRFELNPQDGSFLIKSRPRLSEEDWTINAVGRLIGATLASPPAPHALQAPAAEPLDAETHYQLCTELGLSYGPAFQGLDEAWPDGDGLAVRLRLPEAVEASSAAHVLHPVLVDSCFQSLLALFRNEIASGQRATLLPVRIGRLQLFGSGEKVRSCLTRVVKRSPHSVLAEFRLLDEDGNSVARLEGCRFRGAPISLRGQGKSAEWVYTPYLKPRLSPDAASPLPASAQIRKRALAMLEREEAALRRNDHFQRATPLFDALVAAFAYRAMRAHADEHGLLSPAFLAEAGSQQAYRNWLLGLLQEDGLIAQTAEGWKLGEDEHVPPEDIWLSILGDNPAYLPDLVMAGRVGSHLDEILGGKLDGATLVASISNSAMMGQLLEGSPTYRSTNRVVTEAVTQIVEGWPANRRLRLLEIGQGSRALTRALLPLLPADRCDYVIAECDEEALARAEAEFADHAHVSCRRLNPETMALDNADAQSFDLVLAAHVVHAKPDPLLALLTLKRMLSKGGMLLMAERHADRVADFVFGLDPKWWTAHGSRLSAPLDWQQPLQEMGFAEIEAVVDPLGKSINAGTYALLAKNPDAPLAETLAKPDAAKWLLVVDGSENCRAFAQALNERLSEQGQDVHVAQADAPLPDLADFQHVVNLAGLSVEDDAAAIDLMAVQNQRCITTLDLIHAIESCARPAPPRLWLVTGHGSVVTHLDGTALSGRHIPSQSALWGFGRVIMNEYPGLACTLVDLKFDALDKNAAALLAEELLHPDGEDEILLAANVRHVTRMQRLQRKQGPQCEDELRNVRLDFSIPGQLRNLQWKIAPLQDLADDEIEIRPMAVGLNFRDVMYAMGLLSDEAVENGFSGPSMGMELSGIVTRVGVGVSEFSIGDPVIAFAPASFAKRAVTKAASAVRKPDAWTFEEAATVPTVFFTAYYALHYLARLQPGEKVLIHGAAGGVGIAAIEIARYLGAEVFATAGSDEKRDFVRLLGADHVMNSRNLAFADEIMEITQGRGIDVVLNSLAGEAINRNFRVLRPFGRFLELGKRDFYENTKIGLRPFKDNITYYGIDADQLMVERPQLAQELFREMMGLIEHGALRPLPYRSFPASRIVDAYRYMQQSKQIGKIIISFEEKRLPAATVEAPPLKKPKLTRDASYLVTGGVGGFGLKTARWLAEQGAGHLVLLSRRGSEAPEAAAAVAELEAAGAKVHIKACDVADAASLKLIIDEIGRELPPLRGIVHAAMVLDDGLIHNLDAARFNKVLKPKIVGAWNLHRLTEHLPLNFFVVYSSATTFIGNPGQANYVAANMYLEGLAAYRRAKGLAATSVCWGAIGDVGYLARNEDIKDALQSRLGGAPLASDKALAQLGDMIATGRSGVAIIDFDWHTLNRFLPSAKAPRFDELRRNAGKPSKESGSGEDIQALIANHSEEEVKEILQQLLIDEIAQILRLPPERIPVDRSLYDIGMDSLMGVELVLSIENRFGITLPMMALSEGPTITRITERLVQMLLHADTSQDGTAAPADDDARMKDMLSGMAAQHGVTAGQEDLDQAVAELKKQTSAGGASA